ncbi:chromosome partitioning protein ParB [Arthrobacter sp. AET 35A]|nr:chromosome partitioning protein ParB [Arthrobacter sp. AET 35A]
MSSFGKMSPGRPSAGKSKDQLMDSLKDTEPVRRVNFDLPQSKHQKLRIAATRRDQSIREFLTEYIDSLPDE